MIDTTAIPQVALDCLNKDHYDVAELLNRLEPRLADISAQELKTALAEIYKHLKDHFACEEHQMSKYEFPALFLHQQEHMRVLAQFTQQTAGESAEDVKAYFEQTFCPWLIEHIATLDMQTARYIVTKGGS